MRIPVIAGNWKMHKTIDEAKTFLKTLISGELPEDVETVICAPFTALAPLVEAAEKGIGIGAQNLHWAEEGAFTGEVSARMLTDIGVRYVIIGHSERRAYFAETDETVNRKGKTALKHGLIPIICVGESLEEREQEKTKQVVREQIVRALEGLGSEEVKRMIFAYEPIWAIGTGRASTAEDAGEVIGFIRRTIADLYDQQVANEVRILYGGSVKPNNIDTFLAESEIDGALVGGASLDPESFRQLVAAAGGKQE